jgi:hypothetical protein
MFTSCFLWFLKNGNLKTLTSSKTFFKRAFESRHFGLYNSERIRSLALSVEIRQASTFVPRLLHHSLSCSILTYYFCFGEQLQNNSQYCFFTLSQQLTVTTNWRSSFTAALSMMFIHYVISPEWNYFKIVCDFFDFRCFFMVLWQQQRKIKKRFHDFIYKCSSSAFIPPR